MEGSPKCSFGVFLTFLFLDLNSTFLSLRLSRLLQLFIPQRNYDLRKLSARFIIELGRVHK